MPASITTVLFDVDGTLVDSNEAHAAAWVDALHEGGFDIAFERVRPLLGMGADQLLPQLDERLHDDTEPGKTIAARRKAIFLTHYAPTLEATRGARDLVLRMRALGVRCVIASSASNEELEVLLRVADVTNLFDAQTTSADAEASKPAPDIVSAALQRSRTAADRAVMLGDTRFDIEAAHTAGVGSIALRCGGAPERDFDGAVAVFDDPAALVAALDDATLDEIGAGETTSRP